jgi:hypothetical protein
MNADGLHAFYDIVSLLGIVAAAWVGLLIKNALGDMKNAQAEVKADLIAKQTEIRNQLIAKQGEIKDDLTEKHSENRQDLAVHQAKDEQMFLAVNRILDGQNAQLTRIENKIDKANGGR